MNTVLILVCVGLIIYAIYLRLDNKKLKRDQLTGLANRNGMADWSDRRMTKNGPIGAIYIDLDELKAVNDTQTHAAGDELLQNFSSKLNQACRKGDLVVRWGGDEFLVLLRDVNDIESIQIVVQRIRDCVHPISVSIGFAVCHDRLTPINELIGEADEMMLIEKKKKHAAKATAK